MVYQLPLTDPIDSQGCLPDCWVLGKPHLFLVSKINQSHKHTTHHINSTYHHVNSLAPGRSGYDSKNGTFNLDLLIGIYRSHDNALRWMPQDLSDDKSILDQVMAWCRQATSHYQSQCWLSSLSPYGIARPQWVNHIAEWFISCLSWIL